MSLELKDLLPLLTTAVGSVVVWLQESLRNRHDRHREKLARDETVEMIELLEKWMKTQEIACSPEEFKQVKKAAHQRLDDMYLTLDKLQELQTKHTTETPRPLVERIFLLNRPSGFSGLMARIVFWVLVLFAGFIAIGFFAQPEPLGVTITFYVLLGILVLPIHAWAVNADAKTVKQKQAGPLPKAS